MHQLNFLIIVAMAFSCFFLFVVVVPAPVSCTLRFLHNWRLQRGARLTSSIFESRQQVRDGEAAASCVY